MILDKAKLSVVFGRIREQIKCSIIFFEEGIKS
jgi:hypothetical protein